MSNEIQLESIDREREETEEKNRRVETSISVTFSVDLSVQSLSILCHTYHSLCVRKDK